MKSYAILLSTVAVLAAPALTHATTVTFTGYGTALPPGETLVTDFSSGLPSTFSGTASVVSGSVAGSYAAPAFSSTTVDTGPYLAIEGGQSETFTPVRAITDLSIYLGSLDTYNSISVTALGGGTTTYTGAQLAALTGAVANGSQTSSSSNGRLTFDFSAPVSSVTFSSSSNAFEIASVAMSVPEPAAWTMMLLGLGALGVSLRRRRAAVAYA
jgi:hypothetical protein